MLILVAVLAAVLVLAASFPLLHRVFVRALCAMAVLAPLARSRTLSATRRGTLAPTLARAFAGVTAAATTALVIINTLLSFARRSLART